MDLWLGILIVLFIGWILWSKSRNGVGREQAIELIRSGALILDVRTPGEFSGKHLPGAVNLPLADVTEKIQKVEPDKSRPILCHCVSGARSGMAASRLRKLGYQEVYNLGSYHHAASIVQAAGGK